MGGAERVATCAGVERLQEGAMRAVWLRHRLPPNLFVRLWRRWMAAQANQLLEAARLGSDKVEYLTHGREMSNPDLCTVGGRHVDDLLRAGCSPSISIPMNWRFRMPLCFVILRGVARCARAGKIVRRLWRAHRPIELGKVGTIGATIVRTPWSSRCSWLCKAVQKQRRSINFLMSPDEME